jgi:4,5-dihydroxyphthalate decarboxylase
MTTLSRRSLLRGAAGLAGASLAGRGQAEATQEAAAAPAITLVCADYVRYMHIANGDVRPEGVRLEWIRGDRTQMLRRAATDPTVDGGEASMAQHVMRLANGDRSMVAIPIFPLRNFTARDAYVRAGSKLTPTTLEGKRLGIYGWAASGAVWKRHMMRWNKQDPAKVTWVVGDADVPSTGTGPANLPPYVSYAPKGKNLTDLLLAGDIEAMMVSLPPAKFYDGSGTMARLEPDYRLAEQRYYQDTRCFPPQHVILIRKAVWDRHPWVGRRLVAAFEKADAMFDAVQRLYPYNSPWLIEDVEQAERHLGRRGYAPGIEANRHVVDAFCGGAFRDGMTSRRVTTDEFFAEFLAS